MTLYPHPSASAHSSSNPLAQPTTCGAAVVLLSSTGQANLHFPLASSPSTTSPSSPPLSFVGTTTPPGSTPTFSTVHACHVRGRNWLINAGERIAFESATKREILKSDEEADVKFLTRSVAGGEGGAWEGWDESELEAVLGGGWSEEGALGGEPADDGAVW